MSGYRYPQINEVKSEILYVGSSTTGIVNRLKQHLGYGYKGTYSLHLSQWFQGQCKINVYVYDDKITNKSVLQLIEDNMWFELKPMFGKQGSNNSISL